MFKIGDFSRISQVSVKTLRYYDEIGLLKPAHVDRFTGYRYWTSPKRIHHPTEEELYDEAWQCYKSIYHETDEVAVRKNRIIGRDAILACADHVRSGKISPPEVGHMVYFAFKLGAKRALDFATLFDFRDTDLAALKRRQAELFGGCHTLAAARNWPSLADILQQLADVEEEFRVTLLAR